MYNATLPFLIRFLGEDSADETTQSIMPLLNDTMRLVSLLPTHPSIVNASIC